MIVYAQRQMFRYALVYILVIISLPTIYAQIADFTVNRTTGCAGFSVRFQDLSSSSTNDPIVNWRWELGGVISTLQNPGRIFSDPGTYSICLNVETQSGASNRICKDDFIEVFNLPEPNFIGDPLVGCTPLTVTFSDASTSPNGDIQSWTWDLGGTTGVKISENPDEIISTIFNNTDQFGISLTVIDDKGCQETIIKENYIETFPTLDLNLAADQNASCSLPHEVQFTNLSPLSSDVNYYWDFGNGQSFEGYNPGPITYDEIGAYEVSLIGVHTITGCTDTLQLTNFIQIGGEALTFTVSEMAGCAPLMTQISLDVSQSTDSIVWDFGDGQTAVGPEHEHSYTQPGCYIVSVTKYGSECEFTGRLESCIEVYPSLDYSAELIGTFGCSLPHQVQLNVETEQSLDVSWFINDTLASQDYINDIVINDFGVYSVALELRNENGCQDTMILDSIIVEPFTINLNTYIEGCAPYQSVLNYTNNTNSEIASWLWEVYDGEQLLSTYEHEYPTVEIVDTGIYDVRLIVQNNIGCIDTIVEPGYVRAGQTPDIRFSADPLVLCLEDEITFTNFSEPADAWFWDFGDDGTSIEEHPEINYSEPGIFTVTLTSFHNGCPETDSIPEYVEVLLPLATFKPIFNCDRPYEIFFKNNSKGVDSLHWDFNVSHEYNSDLDTTTSPTFIYQDRGIYEVTLTAYNFTTGCEHSTTKEIIITDPIANFEVDTMFGCAPLSVTITDLSQDAVGWNYFLQDQLINIDSTDAEPELMIGDQGLYDDISLHIIDVHGCIDSVQLPVDIKVSSVQAGFSALPNPVCLNNDITLIDTSTSLFAPIISRHWLVEDRPDTIFTDRFTTSFDQRGIHDITLHIRNEWGCTEEVERPIEVSQPLLNFSYDSLLCTSANLQILNFSQGAELSYLWDFGDDTTSDLRSPNHIYQNEGNYTICLKAMDKWGCISQECGPSVSINNPVAEFTADPTTSDCPPLIVDFDNQSLNYTASYWDFGDGSGISDQASPDHIYSQSGSYDVQLIVEHSAACRDTLLKPKFIRIDGPIGQFNYFADTSCAPLEISFSASSDFDYKYTWDFGDGNLYSDNVFKRSDNVSHIYTEIGDFIPKLILEDNKGCELIIEGTEYIKIHDILLDFFIIDTVHCGVPATVNVFNFSQSSLSNVDYSWIVSYLNQDTLSAIQPTLEFTEPGDYSVSLLAQNEFCTRSITYPDLIRIGVDPVAKFSVDPAPYCQGSDIILRDESTLSFGSVANREWVINGTSYGSTDTILLSLNDTGSMEVRLEIVSDYGCMDVMTQMIDVSPRPMARVNNPADICPSESLSLMASDVDISDIASLSWSLNNELLCDSCLSIDVSPSVDGIYEFELISNAGCVANYEVPVHILPEPVIELTEDTLLCKYEQIILQVNGTEPSDLIQWRSATAQLNCLDCTSQELTAISDEIFFVSVTNQEGCEIVDSIYVEVVQDTTDLGIADHVICAGQTVELESPEGELYIWSGDQIDCQDCSSISLTPSDQTVIAIQWQDVFGCTIRDTAIIEVKQLDEVYAGADVVICQGESHILTAQGEGILKWTSDEEDRPEYTMSEVTINPLNPTTYYLSLVEDLCILHDTVFVDVVEMAELEMTGDTICPGDTAWLSYTGLYDDLLWSTYPDILQDDRAGYIINESLFITTTASFRTCPDDTEDVDLVVLPPVIIDAPSYISYYPDEQIDIKVDINYFGDFDISWTPMELVPCIGCLDFSFFPKENVTFNVQVSDVNSGCFDETEIQVLARTGCNDDFVMAPNAFTPNGDGINDLFKVYSEFSDEIESLQIFDRWGSMIYKSNDISSGWDGTFRGKECPSGVYVFFLEVRCAINGRTYMTSSDLTLLR